MCTPLFLKDNKIFQITFKKFISKEITTAHENKIASKVKQQLLAQLGWEADACLDRQK